MEPDILLHSTSLFPLPCLVHIMFHDRCSVIYGWMDEPFYDRPSQALFLNQNTVPVYVNSGLVFTVHSHSHGSIRLLQLLSGLSSWL